MTLFHALVLGIIQGLTEFLPISSSGHLIFIPKFLGWEDQGVVFDIVVHLGTLIAVLLFFRNRVWQIGKRIFQKGGSDDKKLGYLLALSVLPAAVVGAFLESNERNALLIAFNMIVWGIVLWIADRFALKHENPKGSLRDMKTVKQVTWKDALFVGCAQAIALLPGTSRSGITMTAGLFRKLTRESAAEFSFLMSIPIIVLGGVREVVSLWRFGAGAVGGEALVVGFFASALSGVLAIALLMKIVQKWNFTPFVVYRIVVGVLILVLLS